MPTIIAVKDAKIGGIYRFTGSMRSFKVLGMKVERNSILLKAEYCSGVFTNRLRPHKLLVIINEEGEENMAEQLYQLKGTELYGTVIGTNSKGLKVFEIRGSGEVKTVPQKDLEAVIPYSVLCKDTRGTSSTHYWAEEGQFQVGDMVLKDTSGVVIVHKLNTKSKSAKQFLAGAVFRPSFTVKSPE